jgi:prophage antirepressor-like protein
MTASIVPLQFQGFNVRATPDMKLSAVDVLKAIGQANAKAAWSNAKAQYPELIQETCTFSFSGKGRPTEVLSEKGVLKLLMVSRGPRAAAFRDWAASTLKRVASADITLAAEISDKASETDQRWLKERTDSSLGAKGLSRAIASAGCNQLTYGKAHDANNVAVTGLTAREIQSQRGGKITRNLYSTAELALLNVAQVLEIACIESQQAKGDGEVLSIIGDISTDVARLRRKHLGTRSHPHGGLLEVRI